MTRRAADLTLAPSTRSWKASGACQGLDPELFFPDQGEPLDQARAVCGGCVVRMACLEHALSMPERFGVWGGTSERQRRIIRHQRRTQPTGVAS